MVPTVLTPGPAVQPEDALATSMHATPDLYAMLLGSGMSAAAGVKTAPQIIWDLVRRVARSEGHPDEAVGDDTAQWWKDQGRPEPRYDTLLEALADTDAGRHLILRGYFDPPTISSAHQALARLVSDGRVRVIITTNFDPLIEQALDAVGIHPQVLFHPSQVAGMLPLRLAPATVLKLHGDYGHLPLRNSPAELACYPEPWARLLSQIFDDYGLIVVGWSATYDKALAAAITRSPTRRFPMYWVTHNGNLSEEARLVHDNRRASKIDAAGADAFFQDLTHRLVNLDRRAGRLRQPRLLTQPHHMPDSVAPVDWAVLPLLQIRIVATFRAPAGTELRWLRGRHRDRLISTLDGAAATAHLQQWALRFEAAPAAERPDDVAHPSHLFAGLGSWQISDVRRNTHEEATLCCGGDAGSGIAALLTIRPPGGTGGSSPDRDILFDIAVSINSKLELGQVAELLRDGLVLVTNELPAAIDDVLGDTNLESVEAHLMASGLTGAHAPGWPANRPNELTMRIDLDPFGQPRPPNSVERASFQAANSERLTAAAAAALTVDGLDYVALAFGWPNPDDGIDQLRARLGVPAPN